MRLATCALAALLGCGAAVDPAADRARYRLAGLDTPDAAAADCAAIGDAALRDECWTFLAGRLAGAGAVAAARATCARVTTPPWADECPFLVTDRSGLTGRAAADACATAGAYAGHCAYHALRRALPDIDLPDAVGDEQALRRAVASWLDAAGLELPQPARNDAILNLTAERIGQRWAGQDFGRALCGAAERVVFRRAYRIALDASLVSVDLAALCADRVDADRLRAFGLPAWRDGSGSVPREAWKDICEPIRDGSGAPRRPGAPPPPATAH